MTPARDATADRRGPDPSSRNTYSLSTARLLLEPPGPKDAFVLYELAGGSHREEVTATLVWDGPDSVSDMEAWIEQCRVEPFDDFGFFWVIRDASGDLTGTAGRAMGIIGSRPLGVPGRADVGYWLGYPYWGRGIMTETLSALLRFGFETLDYAKVEAEVFVGNARGHRLAESVGMTREGVVRRRRLKRGEWVDEAIYGMLPEELPEGRGRHTPSRG